VEFARFWFNSFGELVGSTPSGDASPAALQSLARQPMPGTDDEHARLVMQSVGQGNNLTADLKALRLNGNKPVGGFVMARKGQRKFPIEGADVTVIGPLESRLEALRKEWADALKKPTKEARQAALQALFLPARLQDKSIPNLSSIVVLVEVGNRKLLLTGDAHGDDVVEAWKELELPGTESTKIDLLKMPHHGSIRNTTESFLRFFEADHYVFSADGKYDNPDAPTIEALVKMHGNRQIVMHFTNADVSWKNPYALEKNNAEVRDLDGLLTALRAAYPGPWAVNLRKPADKSVVVELP
jgi:hypothetical protein